MPDAHTAAVEAMAAGIAAAFGPDDSPEDAARFALAALVRSEAARAALVRAVNATQGWYDPEGAHTAEGEAVAGIRTWVLVDAVLGALAPSNPTKQGVV